MQRTAQPITITRQYHQDDDACLRALAVLSPSIARMLRVGRERDAAVERLCRTTSIHQTVTDSGYGMVTETRRE